MDAACGREAWVGDETCDWNERWDVVGRGKSKTISGVKSESESGSNVEDSSCIKSCWLGEERCSRGFSSHGDVVFT